MESEDKQAYKIWDRDLSLKLKELSYINQLYSLGALCLELNDEFMRLTAALTSDAKFQRL